MTKDAVVKLNPNIIAWGYEYLSTHGFLIENNLPEEVQNTSWSCVVRFITTEGFIYLKHTPELLALEAPIIQILHKQFNASVPEIMANNTELNCFLMRDAGVPLRKYLKNEFDVTLLCQGIEQFTALQLEVSNHVDIFFEMGVPDWRIDKLPFLYQELISQKDFLLANGLTEKEIHDLGKLVATIASLCKKLSSYAIKESMVQPDFQDNNLLIDPISKKITLIDLGEISICHPFFSLSNCLYHAKLHHGIAENDVAYQQLRDACFKNYLAFETKENLLHAFELIQSLWFLYEVLAHYRLMMACDNAELIAVHGHGKLGKILKELSAALR